MVTKPNNVGAGVAGAIVSCDDFELNSHVGWSRPHVVS